MTFGNFCVVNVVGEGGLATVYRVRHVALHTEHALKVLKNNNAGLRQRLLQEGRIQAGLRHPNVVAVTDVVDVEGYTGLIMEFVDGTTLRDVLGEDRPLPVPDALALFGQILAGVSAAHRMGVLHRDLKPGNILLSVEGRRVTAKITDFGVAKCTDDTGVMRLTRTGTMLGTPGYMAPEQALDASRADMRSDIFSLGVILYEMISGKPPFAGKDMLAVLNAVADGVYVPLDLRVQDCPPEIADVVHQAMSAEPSRRFETCDEFSRRLFGTGTVGAFISTSRMLNGPETPAPSRPKEEVASVDTTLTRTCPPTLVVEETDPGRRVATVPRPRPAARRPLRRQIQHLTRTERMLKLRNATRAFLAKTGHAVAWTTRWVVLPAALLLALAATLAHGAVDYAESTRAQEEVARQGVAATFDQHRALAGQLLAMGARPERLDPAVDALVGAAADDERVRAAHALYVAMLAETRMLPMPDGQEEALRRRALTRQLLQLGGTWQEYHDARTAHARAVGRVDVELAMQFLASRG